MIGIIGLSHKSAPVHIREKFALNKEESSKLAKSISDNKHIEEVVIVSTCNRTEIYFYTTQCCSVGSFQILLRQLHMHAGVGKEMNKHFYHFEHEEATRHLFRVVSSLE